ncbi:MAG: hypothetical protein KIT79_15460 [Deltaproteobacteria bacterium]|nr:hypothetical protein [Deltaproteobacteria bacterium]
MYLIDEDHAEAGEDMFRQLSEITGDIFGMEISNCGLDFAVKSLSHYADIVAHCCRRVVIASATAFGLSVDANSHGKWGVVI